MKGDSDILYSGLDKDEAQKIRATDIMFNESPDYSINFQWHILETVFDYWN